MESPSVLGRIAHRAGALVVASSLFVATAVAATAGVQTAAPSDPVEAYLQQLQEESGVPHLSVTASGAEGEQSWGVGAEPTLAGDSEVVIGSVAKSMTATIVLQQVEAGRLELSDDVGSLLPDADLPGMSIEQLLTHTSGYSAADGLRVSERGASGPGAIDQAVADLRRTGEPGRYAYSSANYLVLGAVVQEVTDRPFAAVLRDDLVEPLGMSDTTADADRATPVAGHRWLFGATFRSSSTFDESGSPYGYVVSTRDDLQRYAQAHAGARPDVLDADLLARLHEPRIDAGDDAYAFGWRVEGSGPETVVQHTGAVPGYFTHVLVRPSDARTVVVVADAYGEAQAPSLAAVAPDVLRMLDGAAAEPASGDGLLLAAPWVLLAVVVIAAVGLLLGWRRPRRRGLRWLAAGVAVIVTAVLWWVPGALGSDLGILRTWAPDVAWTLVAALAMWTVLVLVLALRRPGETRVGD